MAEEINTEEIEALFLANEFVKNIHDEANLAKLFAIAMVLPISQPNATFEQRLDVIKKVAKKHGMF